MQKTVNHTLEKRPLRARPQFQRRFEEVAFWALNTCVSAGVIVSIVEFFGKTSGLDWYLSLATVAGFVVFVAMLGLGKFYFDFEDFQPFRIEYLKA